MTPELDAAIAASLVPAEPVLASMAGVRTYFRDGVFSHPIRDAELRAARMAVLRERALAARSARMAELEAQPWFPAWKAAKVAAGQWVEFGGGAK